MRKNLFYLFCIACLLSACSGSASKKEDKVNEESSTTESETTGPSSLTDMAKGAEESQKRAEELKKLTPLTNEQLKAFFAEEVMGIKRSSFSVNSAMGYAQGNAEYRKNDSTNFKVAIYDCAGEAGSAFYGMKWLTGWNMEREDDNGYEKTVSFMGTKALETYNKYNNQYTLNFVTGDRFWVTVEGDHTRLDELKTFVNNLNLDRLKKL